LNTLLLLVAAVAVQQLTVTAQVAQGAQVAI
jgi:hypothetical protein